MPAKRMADMKPKFELMIFKENLSNVIGRFVQHNLPFYFPRFYLLNVDVLNIFHVSD